MRILRFVMSERYVIVNDKLFIIYPFGEREKVQGGSDMELRQLRYFTAVAETLNFSRASEILYVSQSALSKQIAELEQELGVLLFQRDKRTVELSPAGRLLLGEAKGILLRSEKLLPLLQQKGQQAFQERNIFIGIENRAEESPQLHGILTEVLYRERQRLPGLSAVFRNRDFSELKKGLQEDELDLGIFFSQEPEAAAGFDSCVLYKDEMVLVYRGQEEYEETEEGLRRLLAERGVLLIEKEFRGMSQIMGILDAIGSAPKIRFCENGREMELMVESGESSAVIPKSMVLEFHNKKLHIRRFKKPEARLYLVALWKKGSRLAEKLAREAAKELG